jgi:hypothetical protein
MLAFILHGNTRITGLLATIFLLIADGAANGMSNRAYSLNTAEKPQLLAKLVLIKLSSYW